LKKHNQISSHTKILICSTPEHFAVYDLGDGVLDLYYFRHYVSRKKPKLLPISVLESQVRKQHWDDEKSGGSPGRIIDICKRGSNETLRYVSQHPESRQRIRRIRDADYSYPVLVYKGIIVDGLHRIIHACFDGRRSILGHSVDALTAEAFVTPASSRPHQRPQFIKQIRKAFQHHCFA